MDNAGVSEEVQTEVQREMLAVSAEKSANKGGGIQMPVSDARNGVLFEFATIRDQIGQLKLAQEQRQVREQNDGHLRGLPHNEPIMLEGIGEALPPPIILDEDMVVEVDYQVCVVTLSLCVVCHLCFEEAREEDVQRTAFGGQSEQGHLP